MSSWPAPPPAYAPDPGRRSSRSRSPRRREGIYHDPAAHDYASGYPSYGADADHRRAWDEYYERRSRGRSRSPPGDESSRKRRRSNSPYERDRFDPRPRYGDDYDAHSRAYGYSSPRSRSGSGHYHAYQQYPPAPMARSGRAPLDPYTTQPHPASLRQYAEWFRSHYPKEAKEEDDADRAAEKEAGKKTRDGIRARWEKYKKQYAATQLQTLFDHHKKSPWFSEKYNPASEWANLRSRVRKQGWKGRSEQFLKDLEDGKYDPKPEPESPVKEALATGDEKLGDNPEDMDAVDEEVPEPGPDSPTKSETNGKPQTQHGRQPRDDDVLVAPEGNQVAIRTIPPDIGRQKIEEACRSVPGFVHLALGDPLQKRHYYRAGWMKFKDDADMMKVIAQVGEKKIEGFKLHVNHLARPYYARLRQAPEVASSPQRVEKDLQQIKQLALLLEDEYTTLRRMKTGAPEPKIEDSKSHGKDGEQADVPMTENNDLTTNGTIKHESVDSDNEVEQFSERGSEIVERRIEKLVAELQTQLEIAEGDGIDSILEAKKSLIALDLYLAYLRMAFNTCYYCAAVCDHAEELNRKCPRHVRKPLPEKAPSVAPDEAGEEKDDEEKAKDKVKDKEKDPKDRTDRRWERNGTLCCYSNQCVSDERWAEWVDSKIALLINRANVDPVEYGGKNYEDELQKAVEPHIKQEDEGKFRCRTCNKLFKASSFVEKHVANKHPELLGQLEELPFFNNFALDPHRVQPFAHLPPPIGNSTAPPPQAYGLQSAPATYNAMDYGRPMQNYYGPYPPQQYIPYANGGAAPYDYYQQNHWAPPPRRDEPPLPSTRRLQERVGGYAQPSQLTGVEGLPAKPIVTFEPTSGGRRGRAATGPPPPPPPDAKEDPRAASGKKVSYHDMDDVAEGDVELTY
ncbi:hypothetical protein K439DRAFT_1347268 [Ramaria rubella]|nr:hypothetical protein K439DRAFT_1347268 [Ramaria rubella]